MIMNEQIQAEIGMNETRKKNAPETKIKVLIVLHTATINGWKPLEGISSRPVNWVAFNLFRNADKLRETRRDMQLLTVSYGAVAMLLLQRLQGDVEACEASKGRRMTD